MKITPESINKGNMRSVFSGNFINNFSDIVVNPQVNTRRKQIVKSVLSRSVVDEGHARAGNVDNRGFKKKIYSGTKPLFWDKKDFTPLKAGGFTYENGMFRGGKSYEGNKHYKPEFGVAGSGEKNADKPSGQVNPFPIKPRRSVIKDNKK